MSISPVDVSVAVAVACLEQLSDAFLVADGARLAFGIRGLRHLPHWGDFRSAISQGTLIGIVAAVERSLAPSPASRLICAASRVPTRPAPRRCVYRAMPGDDACRARERAAAIIALGDSDSLPDLLVVAAARGGAARCLLPESCKGNGNA